jgi:hypothetical protein
LSTRINQYVGEASPSLRLLLRKILRYPLLGDPLEKIVAKPYAAVGAPASYCWQALKKKVERLIS